MKSLFAVFSLLITCLTPHFSLASTELLCGIASRTNFTNEIEKLQLKSVSEDKIEIQLLGRKDQTSNRPVIEKFEMTLAGTKNQRTTYISTSATAIVTSGAKKVEVYIEKSLSSHPGALKATGCTPN
jgi:hypothetical protein